MKTVDKEETQQLLCAAETTGSPLQQLQSPFLTQAGIRLFLKRDDLLHPLFGGNKWRKLKYNLRFARENGFDTLLTFGGAWSNHIYATAAAGRHYGFKTIGLIRGDSNRPLSATLAFAEKNGMQLHYIDRRQYRQKNNPQYLQQLKNNFGHPYILPEGGSNALAVRGCAEIVDEIDIDFDVICCACGSGATLAGLIAATRTLHCSRQQPTSTLPEQKKLVIGFSALKGGEFLAGEVARLIDDIDADAKNSNTDWHIECGFHFGGYAKIDDQLVRFMRQFQSDYGITLDAVYTGKLLYGLFQLIESASFKAGSTIIAVHSGGLQGNKGFNLLRDL